MVCTCTLASCCNRPAQIFSQKGSYSEYVYIIIYFLFFFQLVDYRVEFTKWWTTEFKTIKFPAQGTVFDYYIDPETHKFEPWNKMVPKFELDPDMPLQVKNSRSKSKYF